MNRDKIGTQTCYIYTSMYQQGYVDVHEIFIYLYTYKTVFECALFYSYSLCSSFLLLLCMFIHNPAFLILSSHLHSILNKLTPDNFSRLSQELVYLASASNDREKLKGAILLVCNAHAPVYVYS